MSKNKNKPTFNKPVTPAAEPAVTQIEDAPVVNIGLTELVDANDKLKAQLAEALTKLEEAANLDLKRQEQLEAMSINILDRENEHREELSAANAKIEDVKTKSVAHMKRIREENEVRIENLKKEYLESITQLQQQQQEKINELSKGNTMTPEQIETLNKTIQQQQEEINQLKIKGNNAMTQEQIETFLKSINELSAHVMSVNTTSQEDAQQIETLKQQLEAATSRNTGIQQELDNAVKEKAELTKWNSKHTLKVAGAVVGAIVIIAGVAYVVRRLLSNGEAEVEAVEVTPELSVVNY